MKLDPRSSTGIMAKGKNVYNGAGSAPNPVGTNQHKPQHSMEKSMLKNEALKRMGKNYGYYFD